MLLLASTVLDCGDSVSLSAAEISEVSNGSGKELRLLGMSGSPRRLGD